MSTPNGGVTLHVAAERQASMAAEALSLARELARDLNKRGYLAEVVSTGRRWPGVRAANTVTSRLAETVQLGLSGDESLAFFWSWGELIGSDTAAVAAAVARVLTATA